MNPHDEAAVNDWGDGDLDFFKTRDMISTVRGALTTHHIRECLGRACCIHNPSDHPLKDRPLNWRGHVMERLCEHGIGHPDPDDSAYRRSVGMVTHEVHGCDGCCWTDRIECDRIAS